MLLILKVNTTCLVSDTAVSILQPVVTVTDADIKHSEARTSLVCPLLSATDVRPVKPSGAAQSDTGLIIFPYGCCCCRCFSVFDCACYAVVDLQLDGFAVDVMGTVSPAPSDTGSRFPEKREPYQGNTLPLTLGALKP